MATAAGAPSPSTPVRSVLLILHGRNYWICSCPDARRVLAKSARAAAVRQELQAEVDQLPEAGPQEGELLAAGGGPHRRAPQGSWQQVILVS